MKFSGEYSDEEKQALREAVDAANERLVELTGSEHGYYVSYLELGGSENGAVDPFYSIGADPTEVEVNES